MEVSVIIITLDRPDYLRRCLECLRAQTEMPMEIIVVDASKQTATATMLQERFPQVVYLRNEQGYGNMPMSRNIGLRSAKGEVIAYLDDDAYAEPQWLEEIVAAYADEHVGAVGGRAKNGQPGESSRGANEIGKILPNGLITQNFGADPGTIVEVDIVLGCNMSFRRDVLARLGGFRENYTATCNCEETDMCSRVKKLGFSISFNPKACVEHVGAPQAKGRRMDLRYDIFGCRNYLMYLVINYGIFSRFFYLALGYLLYSSAKDFARKAGGAGLSMICRVIGVATGLCMGLVLRSMHGSAPERRDEEGEKIRRLLSSSPSPLLPEDVRTG